MSAVSFPFNIFSRSSLPASPTLRELEHLSSVADSEARTLLEKAIQTSIDTNQPKILDLCQRTVSLEQLKRLSQIPAEKDLSECARAELPLIPKPTRTYENLTHSVSHRLSHQSGKIGKVVQYLIATVSWTYSIDLDSPPKNRWAAQGQWSLFRSVLGDVQLVGVTLVPLFSSKWKGTMIVIAIVASLVGLRALALKYHLFTPENLAKYIRNLTREAKEGKLEQPVGREQEMSALITCLSAPPGKKSAIPILVGDPGVGKTQLIEGLAERISSEDVPTPLIGKKVFVVNTSKLQEWGDFSEDGYRSRIDLLFEQIKDCEEEVIVFFDEIHNAASSAKQPGMQGTSLLESLKTTLLEKNIRCVLATTTEEYKQYIEPNTAFIDRTHKIVMNPLTEQAVTTLIQQKAASEDTVTVDPDVAGTILEIARSHPSLQDRASPRKELDVLQAGIRSVYSWSPTKLQTRLAGLKADYDQQKVLLSTRRSQSPGWSHTAEGQAALADLKQKEDRIRELETRIKTQTVLCDKIFRLQTLFASYRKKEYAAIHHLAKITPRGKEAAEKEYLFLQHILLPQLRRQTTAAVEQLQTEFDETKPLTVNAAAVRALYA